MQDPVVCDDGHTYERYPFTKKMQFWKWVAHNFTLKGRERIARFVSHSVIQVAAHLWSLVPLFTWADVVLVFDS